tara:strand:+ start:6854 stop:7279 length:426 start_codon:yes stop_codon:yes gene_type:complete
MPRGSYEDRGREDRSYRKTVGRLSSQKHYSDNTLAIKAAVASGKMDTLLIIPTSALDSMVFDKRVDESDFGRVKKSPKAYFGSNRGYWDTLIAIAEGNTTVGDLRNRFGDVSAASTIAQTLQENLIEFDDYRIQNIYRSSL